MINDNLEAQAKMLYDYWFNQFEFPNEDGKPYKSSKGKMIWSEVLNREIPVDWDVRTFESFMAFEKGKIPEELIEHQIEDFLPYLTIDVANGGKPQYCNQHKMPICHGETIMVMDGAASGDVYVGNKGVLGSTFSMISSQDPVISDAMIFRILKSNSSIYKRANTGSTVPHANRKFIEKMHIALPKELTFFSETFDLLQKTINRNKIEILKLTELRDWLLPLLMNGQITVK